MTRWAVVIERAESNYSAYVPDLPGCIATGKTVAEVEREIREAIEFHIEGMRKMVSLSRNHRRSRIHRSVCLGSPTAPAGSRPGR